MSVPYQYIEALYHRNEFHHVILLENQCCINSYLYVLLSLLAIGRAPLTEHLFFTHLERLHPSDPQKFPILSILHSLYSEPSLLAELKYLERTSKLRDREPAVPQWPTKLPSETPYRCYDQVMKFVEAGAIIQPGSYAESSILDKERSQFLAGTKIKGPVLFEAMGQCQAMEETISVLHGANVYGNFVKDLELKEHSLRNYNNLTIDQYAEAMRPKLYLAAYYGAIEDSARAVALACSALEGLIEARASHGPSNLAGVLVYDRETLAIIAMEYVDVNVDDRIEKMIFEQLCWAGASAGIGAGVGPEPHGATTGHSLQARTNGPIPCKRRVALLYALGHLLRVKAYKNCHYEPIILAAHTMGIRTPRDQMISVADKYARAAAMLPWDDPRVVQRYEQVIWALILASEVDLRVLWVFYVIRNYMISLRPWAYTEPSKQGEKCRAEWPNLKPGLTNSLWPQFGNRGIIFRKFYDLCYACISKDASERPEKLLLLPNTVECDNYIFFQQGGKMGGKIGGGGKVGEKVMNKDMEAEGDNKENSVINFPLPEPISEEYTFQRKQSTSFSVSPAEVQQRLNSSANVLASWLSVYQEMVNVFPKEIEEEFIFR